MEPVSGDPGERGGDEETEDDGEGDVEEEDEEDDNFFLYDKMLDSMLKKTWGNERD